MPVMQMPTWQPRQRAATGQTAPIQVKQPTNHATTRWFFQCVEGVSLVTFPSHQSPPHRASNLALPQEQIAVVLGPLCHRLFKVDD